MAECDFCDVFAIGPRARTVLCKPWPQFSQAVCVKLDELGNIPFLDFVREKTGDSQHIGDTISHRPTVQVIRLENSGVGATCTKGKSAERNT
jgi:hypothetical protein